MIESLPSFEDEERSVFIIHSLPLVSDWHENTTSPSINRLPPPPPSPVVCSKLIATASRSDRSVCLLVVCEIHWSFRGMPFAHGAQPENSETRTMGEGIDVVAFTWTRCAQTAFPTMLDECVFTRRYKARFSGEMLDGAHLFEFARIVSTASSKRGRMLAAFEATRSLTILSFLPNCSTHAGK